MHSLTERQKNVCVFIRKHAHRSLRLTVTLARFTSQLEQHFSWQITRHLSTRERLG